MQKWNKSSYRCCCSNENPCLLKLSSHPCSSLEWTWKPDDWHSYLQPRKLTVEIRQKCTPCLDVHEGRTWSPCGSYILCVAFFFLLLYSKTRRHLAAIKLTITLIRWRLKARVVKIAFGAVGISAIFWADVSISQHLWDRRMCSPSVDWSSLSLGKEAFWFFFNEQNL